MGYSRGAPKRELNEPHHKAGFRLIAKRDLLGEVARMYAHGTATMGELEDMAVEYATVRREERGNE